MDLRFGLGAVERRKMLAPVLNLSIGIHCLVLNKHNYAVFTCLFFKEKVFWVWKFGKLHNCCCCWNGGVRTSVRKTCWEKGRVEDLKRKQRSCSGVGIEDIVNYIVTLPVAQCVVPGSIWR